MKKVDADKVDKNSQEIHIQKDYLIAQAGNILAIALCACTTGDNSYEDKNIEIINQYLKDYDSGDYYSDENVRKEAYLLFVEKNMPKILNIIKAAIKNENVNKVKWFPLINVFIEKAGEYIEAGKCLLKD